jgi:hypothetical protein
MDRETFGVEDQYMIGASLMVKPVVKPVNDGGNTVSVYLPGQQVRFSALKVAHTMLAMVQLLQLFGLWSRRRTALKDV